MAETLAAAVGSTRLRRPDTTTSIDSPSPSISSASTPEASVASAHVVSLRLLFTAWITHFRSLGYVKESTMDMMDKTVLKKAVELTVRDGKARVAIGTSEKVWSDMVDLFHVAIPSLESRTYVMPASVAPLPATDAAGMPYDAAAGGSTAPASVYDGGSSGPSSNMMVANSGTLLRDLQRLDSILALARNVLTAGEQCQNVAAQVGFDREVCAAVNLCVKITARGFDGDGTGTADEDKWNAVVNGFKKLLITSLQFLSNLVTMNERLKLMLWVELFDNSSDIGGGPGAPDPLVEGRSFAESWVASGADAYVNSPTPQLQDNNTQPNSDPATRINTNISQTFAPKSVQENHERLRATVGKPLRPPTPYFVFLQLNRDKIKADLSIDGVPTAKQLVYEGTRRWNALSDQERQEWRQRYMANFEHYKKAVESYKGPGPVAIFEDETVEEAANSLGNVQLDNDDEAALSIMNGEPARLAPRPETRKPSLVPKQVSYHVNPDIFSPINQPQPDFHMMESAADGAKKLAEGKSHILKRLASDNPMEPLPLESPASPLDDAISPSEEAQDLEEDDEEEHEDDDEGDEDDEEDDEEEEEEEEEESSEEDDYAIPGEDGRGLLTDVPLILGPNEIEVLPMIIMSGIVPPGPETKQVKKSDSALTDGAINMYTIRCHLLLAQENGRNLLRELLIFVAAWDLREEELYFKFMVKIMEAILMNGLMPFAYNAFKESKDIISPAQAVIMKLLTKIFHSRQAYTTSIHNNVTVPPQRRQPLYSSNAIYPPQPDPAQPSPPPLRFDIQIVHFLFSEFRQNIIPQIAALIFLQGQIRNHGANLESFPLNLWDMERMYEGVYQYLEFFAILTDHESWKQLMADWEVAYELVTLLRELEVAIPKSGMVGINVGTGNIPEPLMVDRKSSAPGRTPSPAVQQQHQHHQEQQYPHELTQKEPLVPAPIAVERPYDLSSPSPPALHHTDLPPSTTLPPIPPSLTNATLPPTDPPLSPSPYPSALHDEPSAFEWRNLKKLCVLVLSSLVWKNRRLQDQVRRFEGIPAILSCCAFDEHNPYIREHAIMCLRFLLEGNKENQEVVKKFADADQAAAEAQAQAVREFGGPGDGRYGMGGRFGPAGVDSRYGPGGRGGFGSSYGDAIGAPSVGAGGHVGSNAAAYAQTGVQVPMEVLDSRGYETYMDGKGKVGLRRKETGSRDPDNSINAATGSAASGAATEASLAEARVRAAQERFKEVSEFVNGERGGLSSVFATEDHGFGPDAEAEAEAGEDEFDDDDEEEEDEEEEEEIERLRELNDEIEENGVVWTEEDEELAKKQLAEARAKYGEKVIVC